MHKRHIDLETELEEIKTEYHVYDRWEKNMQFRDVSRQYQKLKVDINREIQNVLEDGNFISGIQVEELERDLAKYIGVKHCITCGNGTDALSLALMTWEIGPGDAVFVPDFTFFATGEVVAMQGATPIFVDVEKDSFNLDIVSLEDAIKQVLNEGVLCPKLIIPVDLFGQPADYDHILPLAQKYGMYVLEDGAQGFGGALHGKNNCSFGDISTTSFFPVKPLGCYGDGGAIFTNNDEWAELLRSYRIHGKGLNKYDNIRIGINSRLDTIQAAILKVKLSAFAEYELDAVNNAANRYTDALADYVKVPYLKEGFYSSWAQYTIILQNIKERNNIQEHLRQCNIPTMIYYPKEMHNQRAFAKNKHYVECNNSSYLVERVLSLPMHPYITDEEQIQVISSIINYFS